MIWKDYTNVISEDDANKKDTYEEVVCFEPGAVRAGRNMSLLKNNKLSRDRAAAGRAARQHARAATIPRTCRTGTSSTSPSARRPTCPSPRHQDDEEDEETAVPADLFYTFTRDRGQTFFKRLWEVNPDSSGNYAGETSSATTTSPRATRSRARRRSA
jgi:hypothetical protein